MVYFISILSFNIFSYKIFNNFSYYSSQVFILKSICHTYYLNIFPAIMQKSQLTYRFKTWIGWPARMLNCIWIRSQRSNSCLLSILSYRKQKLKYARSKLPRQLKHSWLEVGPELRSFEWSNEEDYAFWKLVTLVTLTDKLYKRLSVIAGSNS